MRKFLNILICLLVIVSAASAQMRNVPSARFGHNRIEFPGYGASFERIFAKLDSLRSGEVCDLKIAYIGGSHIQGGTLTRELRNDLLSLGDSLDGGRGLVFPFRAAKTNTPTSYISRAGGVWTVSKNTQKAPAQRLGLTGMAVTTADTAYVQIIMRQRDTVPTDRKLLFNKATVLGYANGGDRHPVLTTAAGDTIQANLPDSLAAGDSLLANSSAHSDASHIATKDTLRSLYEFVLPEMTDSINVFITGTSGTFTLTGILLENGRSGVTVHDIGVNGASLVSYSRCQDLEEDLAMIAPDLVIFGIGINDASGSGFTKELFIERYNNMIVRVRAASPDCALLFVTNNDSYRHSRQKGYYVNNNGPLVEEAFYTIAKQNGGAVWDLFDIMGGLKSMREWELSGLAKRDKIHFTDEGYRLLGDLLFNAMMDKCTQWNQNGESE